MRSLRSNFPAVIPAFLLTGSPGTKLLMSMLERVSKPALAIDNPPVCSPIQGMVHDSKTPCCILSLNNLGIYWFSSHFYYFFSLTLLSIATITVFGREQQVSKHNSLHNYHSIWFKENNAIMAYYISPELWAYSSSNAVMHPELDIT